MAFTFESAQYALQKSNRVNTSRIAPPNVASGTVEFAVIPYTLAATEAGTNTIGLDVLPAGAIPIPQLSSVTCSADPGTTLTLDIGTAANPDGWADGIVLSAGGKVECASATMPAWLAATPITADTDPTESGTGNAAVYATVASADTLTVSVVLYFVLAFKRAR